MKAMGDMSKYQQRWRLAIAPVIRCLVTGAVCVFQFDGTSA